jgi:hypothetical protein
MDVFNKSTGRWNNRFEEFVSDNRLNISDFVAKYCGETIQVQVSAQDALGAWSSPSKPLQFELEYPAPG